MTDEVTTLPADDDVLPAPAAEDALAAPATDLSAAPLEPGDDAPDSGPLADAPPLVAERPREIIRGIHSELLCQCEECAPDFVELQWFSVDEAKKTKGDAMLFCGRSSRKYFSPILAVHAWLDANGGARKGRKGGGGGNVSSVGID